MTEQNRIIWSSKPNDSAAGTDGIRAMPKSKAAASKKQACGASSAGFGYALTYF